MNRSNYKIIVVENIKVIRFRSLTDLFTNIIFRYYITNTQYINIFYRHIWFEITAKLMIFWFVQITTYRIWQNCTQYQKNNEIRGENMKLTLKTTLSMIAFYKENILTFWNGYITHTPMTGPVHNITKECELFSINFTSEINLK